MNPRIGILGTSILVTLIVIGILPLPLSEAANEATDVAKATPQHLMETYGRLPLSFESNTGQIVSQVKFLSRGRGYTLFLTERAEAVLVLEKSTLKHKPARPADRSPIVDKPQGETIPSGVLRIKLAGANPTPQVEGLEELPGKANYFIGNDPKTWRTNVPIYGKVKAHAIYPGVDLVYYGNQQQLEHDFIVAPGADPASITMAIVGAEKMSLNGQGDLILAMKDGQVRFRKPVVYQEIEGVRHEIPSRYWLKGGHGVSFQLAAYDRGRPLIIDPVLAYSTYLGGSDVDDGFSIAVDSGGNAYVTGVTFSTNFPTTSGAFQTSYQGGGDAFVTKLNPAGSALVYSTYLGGSDEDLGNGIAVDSSFNAYVTGRTSSANFPTTSGAFQTSYQGGGDAFVTKLNPAGSALVYSTYLGGNGLDESWSIAVDATGSAYVTGDTNFSNFPMTPGAFQTVNRGSYDAFVTKLNPLGTGLLYSTYLGGTGQDSGQGITVDGTGNAYVTGFTYSSDFPTTTLAFQPAYGGNTDAFVTKLNATGSVLVYATYLGGSGFDRGNGIATDSAGNAYVTGQTFSANFPTTMGAFQTSNGGTTDAFVTKLNATGSALVYSTYLGGTGDEFGFGIAVDSARNAYVTGYTTSSNFPTTANAIQSSLGGGFDAFVTAINPLGTAPLVYSSYLGGNGLDEGFGIALDTSFSAYVTGITDSTNFPTTTGSLQTMPQGNEDAFVTKIANIACTQKEEEDDDSGDHERRDHRHKGKFHPCKRSGEEESEGRGSEKE